MTDLLDRPHASPDTQNLGGAVDPLPPPEPKAATTAHDRLGSGGGLLHLPAEPKLEAAPIGSPARLEDVLLLVYADSLDGLERLRIATENRCRSLAQVKEMDGTPEMRRMEAVVTGIKALEHTVELDLRRAMRAHPLAGWVKAQRGLGDKQVGRLLAAIGDPYIDHRSGTPRTVSQLWAYCGYHVLPGQTTCDNQIGSAGGGVAARRRKGQQANWNPTAKMRAFLIATSCVKSGGPYRDIYDRRREHTAMTHPEWEPGHSHNDALRVTAKAILKALWRESRRLHGETAA